MIRTKLLLLFVLPGVLLFTSCSDLTNGDEDSDNGDDPIEPTATVDNPGDGATLEGEATFAVGGEAENGFTELRIFVGDEEVETVSDPSLPYEHTITTYDWDNGDYDLRAELDVAEQDTSVEASVSTTFENYLIEIQTGGKISQLQGSSADELLFVAAPDGMILDKINLKDQQDGVLKILPPEELPESGAPSHFSLTTVSHSSDNMGNSSMFIITDTAFEPWSNVSSREVGSSSGEGGSPDTVQTQVTLGNYPDNHPSFQVNSSSLSYTADFNGQDPFTGTFDFLEGTENVILTTIPNIGTYSSSNVPLYYWKNDLEDGEDVEYDIGADFTAMETHSVEWPSGLSGYSHDYSVSIAEDSFDDGGVGPFSFSNEPSSGSYNMYVPNTTHQYSTFFSANDANEDNTTYYQSTSGELPDAFEKLDYTITVDNEAMDNTEFSVSGNDSPDAVFHWRYDNNGANTWVTILPDTTGQFVYPKIADSLDQNMASNYDRSSFEQNYVFLEMVEVFDLENYQEYQANWFELSTGWYPSGRAMKTHLELFQQAKVAPGMVKSLENWRKSDFGEVPLKKNDDYGNIITPEM